MARTDEERHAVRIREILAHQPMLSLVLDSGATHHVVGNPQDLSNLRDLRPGVPFRVADGFSLTATRIGDISIRGIEIKDVYLVPGLKMNLISVRELADDDIVCTFHKNYVDLSKGDKLIGGGILCGGLYQIYYLDATGDAAPAGAASDPDSGVTERGNVEETKNPDACVFATGAAHHAMWIRNVDFEAVCHVEVYAADGTQMQVLGRGNVVTQTVDLPDVWYVPGLTTNLVSVGQLTELDYTKAFGRAACLVSSPADGTVVGRAHTRDDGLYVVDNLTIPIPSSPRRRIDQHTST